MAPQGVRWGNMGAESSHALIHVAGLLLHPSAPRHPWRFGDGQVSITMGLMPREEHIGVLPVIGAGGQRGTRNSAQDSV